MTNGAGARRRPGLPPTRATAFLCLFGVVGTPALISVAITSLAIGHAGITLVCLPVAAVLASAASWVYRIRRPLPQASPGPPF